MSVYHPRASNLRNGTPPQHNSVESSSTRQSRRYSLPSVRPLNAYHHNPGEDWGRAVNGASSPVRQYPSSFSRATRPQHRAESVASSFQSERSLAPSSLRYVGVLPSRQFSPLELLGGREAPRLRSVSSSPPPFPTQPSSVSSRFVTPPRVATPTRSSAAPVKAVTPPPLSTDTWLHPLLRQALSLAAAAEVEGRLDILQEETDAFDDILALFSIAKEVEAVRVVAFELFELQADARHALYAQEKRERRTIRHWYIESHENAVLSHEVRLLQLEESRHVMAHAESLLRSRSHSLQQQTRDLFERGASARVSSAQRAGATAQPAERSVQQPTRQLSYPTNNSPESYASRSGQRQRTASSEGFTSTSYSTSSTSSPARSDREAIQTTNRFDNDYAHPSASWRGSDAAMESALDDRIARQQMLLAGSGANGGQKAAPLFPRRAAPSAYGTRTS